MFDRKRMMIWGALGIATLGAISCGSGDEGQARPEAAVTSGPLTFEGSFYGEIVAANKVDIHVPDVPQTNQLTVDSVASDGDRVEQGDVILTFVRETLEMDLRDELEKLEVARANRDKIAQQLDKERIDLELDVKRKQLALDRAKLQVVEGVNLISKLELDRAKLDVQKAELELELAKKALSTFNQKRAAALKVEALSIDSAQRQVDARQQGLELIEVTAPVAGIVYAPYTRLNWQRTKVAPGVVARPGDKVLEIPDLSAYHTQIYVRQRDAALIHEGDEAVITPLILPNTRIQGKVIKKDSFATTRNERFGTETPEGNLKEYLITIAMQDAPTELRPGNSARVTISSTLAEDATLLPVPFVSKSPDETWSVTLPDGTQKSVELGRTNLSFVEIVSGLEAGQRVVLPDPQEAAEVAPTQTVE